GAVLHRLERLERRLTIAAPDVGATHSPGSAGVADPASAPPAHRPEPPSRSAQPPAAQPPAAQPPVAPSPVAQPPAPEAKPVSASDQLDAAAGRRVWPALLDAVREQSRTTQVLLSNATANSVAGSTLVLTLPNAALARRLGDERNVELIKQALRAVLGVDWQVRCEHADGDAGSRGAQQQSQKMTQRTGAPPRSAEHPASRRPAAQQPPDDGIPPPPQPPDAGDPGPPPPVDDDEAMLADAASVSREHSSPRDPEEVALALLTEQLGARRIDDT
ncbi:MAG: DNA polymerase III subunit gamma/tau, partial [Pseudonocardiaceae bacterium]